VGGDLRAARLEAGPFLSGYDILAVRRYQAQHDAALARIEMYRLGFW
jgi:hypothetical protein